MFIFVSNLSKNRLRTFPFGLEIIAHTISFGTDCIGSVDNIRLQYIYGKKYGHIIRLSSLFASKPDRKHEKCG